MTRTQYLQVGVYLVARDEHAMTAADVPNAPEFVRAPGPSGRIVRIRKNEELRVSGLAFQILKVNFVGEVSFGPVGHGDAAQPVFDDLAILGMDD